MKNIKILFTGVLILVASVVVNAQEATTTTNTAENPTATLSKKLGLFIFPANDQSKEQQEKDEFDCYKWAVDQSGVDPIAPPKVEAEKVETGPDGGAVKGAAGGAVKGAAIGAIAGDAGKGAAIGATAGGMRGAGRSAGKQQQKQQQADANAKAQEKELMDSFVKAFTVCLEGKGYKVSK